MSAASAAEWGRPRVERELRRDGRYLRGVPVIYGAMVLWGWFAMGRTGVAILLPAAVAAGGWIFWKVGRRMREARVALEAGDPGAHCAKSLDATITTKRRLRWSAPVLVAITLGPALVLVRSANPTYWAGAFGVGSMLLVAAVRAHVTLRRDLALRASLVLR